MNLRPPPGLLCQGSALVLQSPLLIRAPFLVELPLLFRAPVRLDLPRALRRLDAALGRDGGADLLRRVRRHRARERADVDVHARVQLEDEVRLRRRGVQRPAERERGEGARVARRARELVRLLRVERERPGHGGVVEPERL
jgi:hypothetical protein